MSGSGVEIRLLGGVSVRVGAEPVELGGDRVRALLAVLALAAGEAVATPVLAERIWGDEPPANIRPSLHTLMTRLRRAIGAELVATSPAGYSLRLVAEQVDVHQFSRLLRAAAQANDPAAELESILAALALWGGRPFDGARSGWLEDSEAPRLTEQYLAAVERRVDLGVQQREQSAILAQLRELTITYPLRESLWVRLLRLLAGVGRAAEALELYEDVRVRIADELGVDPGAELRALHAELLLGTPKAPVPARVFVPRQLPADLPAFAGRRRALAFLDGVHAAGRSEQSAVIVAIDGTGGAGKSALAVHWAHRARASFPDGQLYLNLRGYSAGGLVEPVDALQSLLLGLGVPTDEMPVGIEARSALLRTLLAEKQLLVVLDNARNAAQVRPLLPGAGGFVIVTSRNQLRGLVAREGARRLSLGQMTPEESTELLARVVSGRPYDVAQLTAFAELCGRLPLALVVGAERASRSPGANITKQLSDASDRLAALEIGDDELTSVRAVLSWSYQALPADAARLFRMLGVYPGAVFEPPAVAALTGLDEVEVDHLLDVLVEANLLEQASTGSYQLHDLIRLYAAGLDEPGESRQAVARLLDWLAQTAQAAKLARGGRMRFNLLRKPLDGVRPLTFGSDAEALAWFRKEWPTLLAAVIEGAEHEHHWLAAALASELWDFLEQERSPSPAALKAHETAVRSARAISEPLLEAVVGNQLAVSYGLLGRFEESLEVFLHSLALMESVGHRSGLSMVHGNLGMTYRRLGEMDAAVRHLEQAMACSDEDRAYGAAQNNFAHTLSDLGRHQEAIDNALQAVERHRRDGYHRGVAYALDTAGLAYQRMGDYDQAIEYLTESARLCRELELGAAEVPTLISLGEVLQAAGRHQEAHYVWQQALVVADRQGLSQSELRAQVLRHLDAPSKLA
ncbi:tetratricopeptide repeat protein [Kribbella sandramycini]|uniref:DNA-binding SARP family transcriptional activator n=1 Tax=Kribbella sandramycini TaxID=60450 RepID=A0A7Y4L2R3_9ACTN|nr:BTAD domain-containing putative transcriptional regulator [Kribbella sandramycini]MBB6571327.1 DNA-binding SARP family transcriptional activator [Kribbella sandramycini]NOL43270.1 tetratricopeptide repeat protein [Kribbella sandramycini]